MDFSCEICLCGLKIHTDFHYKQNGWTLPFLNDAQTNRHEHKPSPIMKTPSGFGTRASDGTRDRQTETERAAIVPASMVVCARKQSQGRAGRYIAPYRAVCPACRSCTHLTAARLDADKPPTASADRRHTTVYTRGQRERESVRLVMLHNEIY